MQQLGCCVTYDLNDNDSHDFFHEKRCCESSIFCYFGFAQYLKVAFPTTGDITFRAQLAENLTFRLRVEVQFMTKRQRVLVVMHSL